MAVEGDMTGGERTMASVLGLGLTEKENKDPWSKSHIF